MSNDNNKKTMLDKRHSIQWVTLFHLVATRRAPDSIKYWSPSRKRASQEIARGLIKVIRTSTNVHRIFKILWTSTFKNRIWQVYKVKFITNSWSSSSPSGRRTGGYASSPPSSSSPSGKRTRGLRIIFIRGSRRVSSTQRSYNGGNRIYCIEDATPWVILHFTFFILKNPLSIFMILAIPVGLNPQRRTHCDKEEQPGTHLCDVAKDISWLRV